MTDSSCFESGSPFPTTRWSLVARAGSLSSPAAREALDSLCRAYWFPIYAFIRRQRPDPEEARDMAQAYFARLLEKGILASVERLRGRLRFRCDRDSAAGRPARSLSVLRRDRARWHGSRSPRA